MTRWGRLLEGKTPPPDGEQLDCRCSFAMVDVYIRIRGKGWFFYLDREWKPAPLGPPHAKYPRDFVDPNEELK